MGLTDAELFVLLDDCGPQAGPARLYRDPVDIVTTRNVSEVAGALARLRVATRDGLHVAGFLSYEAGAGIDDAIAGGIATTPLLWFGLFKDVERVSSADMAALLPDPAGAWNAAPCPMIDRATYERRLAHVLDLIAAGDIYQANLTFPARVDFRGNPLALYARMRLAASAPYGALVSTGEDLILSLSPELFFRLDGDRLLARPMKGTALRGRTDDDDRNAVARLAADPKQQAENLMIVDLLRNDLARVAVPGSVRVPSLFDIETYPTIHQMVSDVTGTLAADRDAVDVIRALFPCGSITGAPKVRASKVIAAVEGAPRGIYTGTIGRIDPDGDAVFNVAIRTLHIAGADDHATIGLGSGIVADSNPHEEWAECLAKGGFVTAGRRPFDLIETMAFDPRGGIVLLDRHLERMKTSAAIFGFEFDRHAVRNALQAATFRLLGPARVRLVLAMNGVIAIELGPMPPAPVAPVNVALRALPVSPDDIRLRHKTSARDFYDEGRRAAGTFDVIFTDPQGRLTEGSISNVFVERSGALVTPPAKLGLLPGILRAELLATGRAVEGELTPADLAGRFYIGNALRGLMVARLVAPHPAPR